MVKLGSKGGPPAMVEAFAGALYARDPELGASILQGQEALKDDRFDPRKGSETNKAAFNGVMEEKMPAGAFAPEMRYSDTGAMATMRQAAVARYAYLAARAGDTKGVFDETRMKTAIADVTGGILRHNGGHVFAPAPGMPQITFDAVVAGLKDSDVPDVTTLSGEPITAAYIRNSAKLVSVGQGLYLVQVNSNPDSPVYAVQGAREISAGPKRFVLDLRGRTAPTPSILADTGYYREAR